MERNSHFPIEKMVKSISFADNVHLLIISHILISDKITQFYNMANQPNV